MNPWLTMLLVLGVLLLLVWCIRLWQRSYQPHPELPRKLLHVGMGLLVLCFPWLFDQLWPVLWLSTLALVFMLLLRLGPSWFVQTGRVLSQVKRQSMGELYYPIAVAAVWWLADGETLLFVIPMLLLTVSDALAALVGVRYGKIHYHSLGEPKSMEGSTAFFLSAFLCVLVPVHVWGSMGKLESLLLAVLLALLIMLIESIAWRGLDNLFVPLTTYALLSLYLDATVTELALRLLVTLFMVIFVLLWHRQSTLDSGALILCALFGYATLMLSSPRWLFPSLILFLMHSLCWPRRTFSQVHSAHGVLSVVGLPFVFVIMFTHDQQPWWFVPYLFNLTLHQAIIHASYLHWRDEKPQPLRWHHIAWAGFIACLLIALPGYWLAPPMSFPTCSPVCILVFFTFWLLMTVLCATAHVVLMPRLYAPTASPMSSPFSSFTLAALGTAVLILMQQICLLF